MHVNLHYLKRLTFKKSKIKQSKPEVCTQYVNSKILSRDLKHNKLTIHPYGKYLKGEKEF